ncbi:uncharacterized protein [Procambarus clarkii]|uniref:uncharacterized protein n=1 Tax=Procambarus clarkii TaxID=6728 RepID=UPI003742F06E
MSRYNSTTKIMLKAEHEEELSESSFFWNQRKHDSLARVLASRFCKAKEAAELIRKELADLSLDEKQLLIWIAELTNLAQSLNKRSVSQNDVQKGIELVCDSIRTKKSQISGVAVSSKMRSRYRAKIEADKKKLRELIAVYNEDNINLRFSSLVIEPGKYSIKKSSFQHVTIGLTALLLNMKKLYQIKLIEATNLFSEDREVEYNKFQTDSQDSEDSETDSDNSLVSIESQTDNEEMEETLFPLI